MKQKIWTSSLILCLILSHLVTFGTLKQSNFALLATFVVTLLLWITVDIAWPSLLCLLSLALIPELGMKKILALSLGNETLAFLLFTFMCTYALAKTSFVRRTAIFFVTSSWAKKGPWQMSILFFLAVLSTGLFIAPTVLFFIFYPILQEIYTLIGLKKGDSFASMLLMGVIICVNLSAGMTPIAHVFPVLATSAYATLTGTTIDYGKYMLFGIPTGIVLFIGMLVIFRFIWRPQTPTFLGLNKTDFTVIKKPRQVENAIVSIFALVVFLWVAPSLLGGIWPFFNTSLAKLGTAFPPLLGLILLALIKFENKALLDLNEAFVKGVSWPSVIMCSATLALGSCLADPNLGFIAPLTATLKPVLASVGVAGMLLLFIMWATIESNISSHIVTSQVVASVAVPLALSGGANALALTSVIGLGASIGCATPPSMPFVAVACSSGWLTTKTTLKAGIGFSCVAIIILYTIGYPLANLIM